MEQMIAGLTREQMLTRLRDFFRANPEEYDAILGLLIRAAIAFIEHDGERLAAVRDALSADAPSHMVLAELDRVSPAAPVQGKEKTEAGNG